jgi:flagellar basal body-associated protein FliL
LPQKPYKSNKRHSDIIIILIITTIIIIVIGIIVIIIINPLQSTVGHRPLQLLAISLDLQHPDPANRPAQIVHLA